MAWESVFLQSSVYDYSNSNNVNTFIGHLLCDIISDPYKNPLSLFLL